jgi:small-conductance mechanosensitive channel
MRTSSKRRCAAFSLALLISLAALPALAQKVQRSKAEKAPARPKRPVSEVIQRILVEEARLDTAKRLATLAATPEERRLAEKAVRLADHELDLSFVNALRRAAEPSGPSTPEIQALEERVKTLEAGVAQQQSVVDQLKKQLAAARGRRKETLQDQFELEQAKLELDSDELVDAHEELINAGGDLQSQIQRLQAEHNAAEKQSEAAGASGASVTPVAGVTSTALDNLKLWISLHSVRNQLENAQTDAATAVDTLHQRETEFQKGAGRAGSAAPGAPAAAPLPARSLEALREQSRIQKILGTLKVRIRDLTELSGTYEKWGALVAVRQSAAGRALIFDGFWIALILLFGLGASRLLARFLPGFTQDRRRLHTLRTITRFGLQVFCLALVLLVVLGPPNQLATLLAFAGAGLTVALKDFIVSFIGWFMLMGSNGVHVGDWVEINGICGEVTAVTLFHTVLLETGNWNDPGHPTGRKVTFSNSYAIEGHYFNFSTSGQWLWDELEVLIPAGESPYAIAGGMLRIVTAETEVNARLAEQEWQKLAPAARGQQPVSAAPAIIVRPTALGISATIRYIARASERFPLRTKLYQQIVDLMRPEKAAQTETRTPSPVTAP